MRMEAYRPEPPRFSDVAAQHLHIKQRLAAALRAFAKYGLDEGVAGHMTARHPSRPGCFWCNSYGVHSAREVPLIRVRDR